MAGRLRCSEHCGSLVQSANNHTPMLIAARRRCWSPCPPAQPPARARRAGAPPQKAPPLPRCRLCPPPLTLRPSAACNARNASIHRDSNMTLACHLQGNAPLLGVQRGHHHARRRDERRCRQATGQGAGQAARYRGGLCSRSLRGSEAGLVAKQACVSAGPHAPASVAAHSGAAQRAAAARARWPCLSRAPAPPGAAARRARRCGGERLQHRGVA